jgi:hypothetical protein
MDQVRLRAALDWHRRGKRGVPCGAAAPRADQGGAQHGSVRAHAQLRAHRCADA